MLPTRRPDGFLGVKQEFWCRPSMSRKSRRVEDAATPLGSIAPDLSRAVGMVSPMGA
jgi:hypothetical protein